MEKIDFSALSPEVAAYIRTLEAQNRKLTQEERGSYSDAVSE